MGKDRPGPSEGFGDDIIRLSNGHTKRLGDVPVILFDISMSLLACRGQCFP
jgi:hypothetical protein